MKRKIVSLAELKDYQKAENSEPHTTSVDITKGNQRYVQKRKINMSKLMRNVLTALELEDRATNPQDFINEP